MKMGVMQTVSKIMTKRVSHKLINELKKEHKEIIDLYEKAYRNFLLMDYESVMYFLDKLFIKYKKHVLKEDNYFYEKLIKKYKKYVSIIDGIKETKEELNEITRKFEMFMSLYNSINTIQVKKHEFSHDLEKLGIQLKERIEFEETRLYILY
ncbi:hemerythrin domain-containing protein [Caminibacter sp.]